MRCQFPSVSRGGGKLQFSDNNPKVLQHRFASVNLIKSHTMPFYWTIITLLIQINENYARHILYLFNFILIMISISATSICVVALLIISRVKEKKDLI